MFEFHIMVDCPYCDKNVQVEACFDEDMEPVETETECYKCFKEFTVHPSFQVEVDTEIKPKKKSKKK